MAKDDLEIKVRRRPWWFWLLSLVWLAAVVLFLQTAIASGAEEEPRAAAISWALTALLVILGAVMWTRSGRRSQTEADRGQ